MIELAALGLLQQEDLHGYLLKQKLEFFMGSCISVNYGTIYPLLKRLEAKGAIASVPSGNEKVGRSKIYSITEIGRALWLQMMMEHPQESWVNARSRFMIKFCFFGFLEPPLRIKLLEHRLMVCRLRQEAMYQERPEPSRFYEFSLWERCQAVNQEDITWLEHHLDQERQGLRLIG